MPSDRPGLLFVNLVNLAILETVVENHSKLTKLIQIDKINKSSEINLVNLAILDVVIEHDSKLSKLI